MIKDLGLFWIVGHIVVGRALFFVALIGCYFGLTSGKFQDLGFVVGGNCVIVTIIFWFSISWFGGVRCWFGVR
jgi:hypothetical protein